MEEISIALAVISLGAGLFGCGGGLGARIYELIVMGLLFLGIGIWMILLVDIGWISQTIFLTLGCLSFEFGRRIGKAKPDILRKIYFTEHSPTPLDNSSGSGS